MRILFLILTTVFLLLFITACEVDNTQLPNNALNNSEPTSDSSEPTSGNSEPTSPVQVPDRTDDTSNGIKVLGEPLEGFLTQVDGDEGNIYVPLFPIAEKLGIETSWDNNEQRATIGDDISIWVGMNYYRKDNSMIEFGPAPMLINDIVYIPRTFIQYALGGYITFIEDGYVLIERENDT